MLSKDAQVLIFTHCDQSKQRLQVAAGLAEVAKRSMSDDEREALLNRLIDAVVTAGEHTSSAMILAGPSGKYGAYVAPGALTMAATETAVPAHQMAAAAVGD